MITRPRPGARAAVGRCGTHSTHDCVGVAFLGHKEHDHESPRPTTLTLTRQRAPRSGAESRRGASPRPRDHNRFSLSCRSKSIRLSYAIKVLIKVIGTLSIGVSCAKREHIEDCTIRRLENRFALGARTLGSKRVSKFHDSLFATRLTFNGDINMCNTRDEWREAGRGERRGGG